MMTKVVNKDWRHTFTYDVFRDYDLIRILPQNVEVKNGKPGTSIREQLCDQAIVVSDSMVMKYSENSAQDRIVLIVNINRTSQHMMLRLSDWQIVYTNMSERMQKRAFKAVKDNLSTILMYIDG